MKVGTARDVREMDRTVIDDYGVPESVLMENAAAAALRVIETRWGVLGRQILLICGSGNNGGDGFALARLLYSAGAAPTVLFVGNVEKLTGSARDNYRILENLPVEIRREGGEEIFRDTDLLVDALFGTGLSRSVEGKYRELIDGMNRSEKPILGIDIPSGVDADSGEVLGTAVRAEATVTFGVPKRGNLLFPGFDYGGRLYHSRISFPPEVAEDDRVPVSVNIPPGIPRRDPDGHKGSFGRVLVIAGAEGYYGAPALAASAALKAGAGYCWLACPAPLVPVIAALAPETVFLPQEVGGDGAIGPDAYDELMDRSERAGSVVLGPGLSSASGAVELATRLGRDLPGGLILDGDGLVALAGKPEISRGRGEPPIFTPHPGEMARLAGISTREIAARRMETARETAETYGAVIVLKGAHTLIAEPGGRVWVNLTGNDGMGTAGSGDVLAGTVGALRAAGMSPADAARTGVYLHGLSGDIAAATLGSDGMTARDILDALPLALQRRRANDDDPFAGKIITV